MGEKRLGTYDVYSVKEGPAGFVMHVLARGYESADALRSVLDGGLKLGSYYIVNGPGGVYRYTAERSDWKIEHL